MADKEKVVYETIIRQVKGEETFTIRTSNRKLKNKLHGYDLEPDDESGATETYEEVPGNWLRLQRPRQFTEEELEETRQRLAKALGRKKGVKPAKGKVAGKGKAAAKDEDEDESEDDDEEDEVSKKRAAKKSPAKGKGKKAPVAAEDEEEDDDDAESDDEEDDTDEDEDEPVEVVKRKSGAKKPAKRKSA